MTLAEDLAAIAVEKHATSITVSREGPYLIRGAFSLVDEQRGPLAGRVGATALCSCGRSRAKPFCDGSHKAAPGWRASVAGSDPDLSGDPHPQR